MGEGEASTAFLRDRFRAYYNREAILLPDRFGRREWGFIHFGGGIIQRHLAFASARELRDFLVERAPAHAYHSSAYYERPGAPTMQEKGWLGADLIFDLDADHIPGSKGMSYKGMLDAVKAQVLRLIDDFLLGDLAVEERHMHIAFSGARGYHVHVRDPRVLELESHERREVVDYITGTGLDLSAIARAEAISERKFKERVEPIRTVALPPADIPGWRGRVTRGLMGWVEELSTMPREEAIARIAALDGIHSKGAEKIYDTLFVHLGKAAALERLRRGKVDFFPQGIGHPHLLSLAHLGLEVSRGATDEPVTSDTKRLIRLMGSLHGKTGLRVTPLRRDELEGFNPLRDAVPETYADDPVRVEVKKAIQVDIKDEAFKLDQGAQTVPEHVAIFLICRGVATLA
jgi:DNA primase small subunit